MHISSILLFHMVCFVEKVPYGTFFNKAHHVQKL